MNMNAWFAWAIRLAAMGGELMEGGDVAIE